jgi:predicted ATPase
MTEVPKVILIDEPQSFLHPGAARKLIEIIRDRAPQHQVIISTHSPTIISAASPKTIALVKQNGPESIIEKIDIDKVESQITCFRELGVSFSDIFGYDRVLWVEGRTEEKCFPLIIKYFLKTSRLGTAIIGVEHTGDFDQKNKQKIESIINTYKRLTETESGLTPPTVDFIFDRENRKTNKIADLKKIGQAIQGRECIYFIKRRIFENYLLNAEAIFDVISELDTERANSLTLYEIKNWIKQNKNNSDYYDRDFPFSEESWTNNIDGAKFLADMFSKNTNSRICYDKTNHSVKLIAKILEISPNDLSELTEMLKNIFNTES